MEVSLIISFLSPKPRKNVLSFLSATCVYLLIFILQQKKKPAFHFLPFTITEEYSPVFLQSSMMFHYH